MFKRLTSGYTLSRILRFFGHTRFGRKKHCIYSKSRRILRLSDGRYKCSGCGKKFSLLTNTYLDRSFLFLDEWYELLWWFSYEFTAHRASKEIGLSQRRVHRCFMIVRRAMCDYGRRQTEKFFGEVEADETYVGAKFKNRRKRRREYYRRINAVKRGRGAKILYQPVVGLYQTDGQVYVEFVNDVEKKTLQDIIKGRIVLESEVYTDTWKSYRGLKKEGYHHEVVDHGKEEYLKENKGRKIHINGIEGFWGYLKEHLLKHHGVDKGNLIYYIKEQEFRFNHRQLTTEEFVQKLMEILVKFGPRNV